MVPGVPEPLLDRERAQQRGGRTGYVGRRPVPTESACGDRLGKLGTVRATRGARRISRLTPFRRRGSRVGVSGNYTAAVPSLNQLVSLHCQQLRSLSHETRVIIIKQRGRTQSGLEDPILVAFDLGAIRRRRHTAERAIIRA